MCVHIYIYIYEYMYVYIYIYIHEGLAAGAGPNPIDFTNKNGPFAKRRSRACRFCSPRDGLLLMKP